MTIEHHEVSVDGRRTGYLTAGSGPPLLLLHAVGESSAGWRMVMPALAARHTVFAPDLPGFATSAPLAPEARTNPTPARLADAVAAFVTAVAGAEPAAVIGNSLGGAVAIELALRHPQRVGELVLEDSAGLGRYAHPALCALTLPGYGDLAVRLVRTRTGAAARAWLRTPLLFARPALAPPGWVDEQRRLARSPQHMRTTLAALRAQVDPLGQQRVMLDTLPHVGMPTLLLWGERDAVLPVSQAREAVGRLPRGKLFVVPGCGHLPHLERPEKFVEALDAFLSRPATP